MPRGYGDIEVFAHITDGTVDADLDGDGHLQVDVLSGGGGGTLRTDGEAYNAADTAIVVLGNDGSNYREFLTDNSGHLQVDVLSGGGGGTQYAEDAAHVSGDTGTLALVVRQDTPANLSGTDGDYEALQVSAGRLWTSAKIDTALPAGTNAIGKLAANSGVDIGDVDVTTLPAITIAAGQTLATLTGITNVVHIDDNAGNLSIDDGGNSITVDATNLDIRDLSSASDSVGAIAQGNIAHDSADSGSPVKVGTKAVLFDGTAPPNAAVAEGDRTNAIGDEYGRVYVCDVHPNYWSVSADYAAAQTNTSIKAAPGAGLSLYITDILISNGATAGNITLLDGSGGTVKWEIYPAINGGCVSNLRTPIKLTANTALCITSTSCTTHSLTICGFIAS